MRKKEPMNTIRNRFLAGMLSLFAVIIACMMAFAPAASAAAGTINPDSYVSDDSNVLSENTKIMIAGMNVKYSGYQDKVNLVFVTRPGALNDDISSYKTKLFNYLGVGSKSDNKGVMILLMPDARKYAVEIGDGITGNLRSVLSNDYLSNSPAIDMLKAGNWDAAAKTMVALTDDQISSVETNTVSITNTVAPMTAAESKANEKMYKQKAIADKASFQKIVSIIVIGVIFVIVMILVVLASVIINDRRKKERHNERMGTITKALSTEGFFNNDGITALSRKTLLNQIDSVADVSSNDSIIATARSVYESDILPSVLPGAGKYTTDEYKDYLKTVPNMERRAWWTTSGIDIRSIVASGDAYIDKKRESDIAFDKAYAEFRKNHSDIFSNPNFDEYDFRRDLRNSSSWDNDVFQLGSASWLWMWTLYNSNGGDTHYAAEPVHTTSYSSDSSSNSSSSYDYSSSSSSSFSGGFDGGFSSGGGGFSGGF